MSEIPAGVAHLWYVRPDEVRDPALLSRLRELLTPGELEAQARRVFPEGRHEFLLTRALARTVLSRYAPFPPSSWTFETSAHGRPEIAGPPGAPRLSFNLSHTTGLVVCLVATDRLLGVDVEDLERDGGHQGEAAERFFAPSEVRTLLALGPEARRPRFLELWTLKESYMKARGLGLSISPRDVSFEVADGIAAAFDPGLADDPRAWQFELLRPTARHLVAVAIRKGDNPRSRIELREITFQE